MGGSHGKRTISCRHLPRFSYVAKISESVYCEYTKVGIWGFNKIRSTFLPPSLNRPNHTQKEEEKKKANAHLRLLLEANVKFAQRC